MIVYCGLRHFYIRHFESPRASESQSDAYYILTHKREIWDFSPELKEHGFTNHPTKPICTIPISLSDFAPFAQEWHQFSRLYTEELEVEYPHAWYLRFRQRPIFEQFVVDFREKLQADKGIEGGIWGAGQSKIVAKLAAHNRTGSDRIVPPSQTQFFLDRIPIQRLPLPEADSLEKLGIKTVGELEKIPAAELSIQFGQRAILLQQLGRGQDSIPFQPRQDLTYSWNLDFTALEGFLRPAAAHELKPYLQQGAQKLAATLNDQQKVAGQIKLEAQLAQGTPFEKKRLFKQATNDAKALLRAAESLLPDDFLAQIRITVDKLEPSPLAQLTMFWEPQAPQLLGEELPDYTQVGMKLSRRERLLILWEECFR